MEQIQTRLSEKTRSQFSDGCNKDDEKFITSLDNH